MKKLICILLLIPIFSVSATWESVESTHFRVYYRENTAVNITSILDIAERFYAELPHITTRISDEPIRIWICDTQKAFQASVHAPIQDWAVGCAFPMSRRIIIQNPTQIAVAKLQLKNVLRHEIAHVLFGQYTQKAVKDMPLWFVEGIAIHFSKEWVPSRHETLLKNVFSKSIFPLEKISEKFPSTQIGANLAYAQSQDTLRWLVEVNGDEALWNIIDELHAGKTLNAAFKIVLGYDLSTFDMLWRESLAQRYHWTTFLSSSYVFWGGLGTLFFLAYLLCLRRRQKRLNQLEQQEESIDPFFREIH